MSAPYKCRICGESREDRLTKQNFMGSLLVVCLTCWGKQLHTWEKGPITSSTKSETDHH